MSVAAFPNPSVVNLPPPDKLRSELAAHLRAAQIIRGLLRLAEAVADQDGRPVRGHAPRAVANG